MADVRDLGKPIDTDTELFDTDTGMDMRMDTTMDMDAFDRFMVKAEKVPGFIEERWHDLKELVLDIKKYNLSVDAYNYGFLGALAAGGLCVAAGLLGHYFSAAGADPAVYSAIEKVCQAALTVQALSSLVVIRNEPDINPYENLVRGGMISLFGEGSIGCEEDMNKGISVATSVYEIGKHERQTLYGIEEPLEPLNSYFNLL